MIHAITYSNSYKYFHFHLNTFSPYLFLLKRIEVYSNPILKFTISIHVSNTTYVYLPSTNLTLVFWKQIYNHLPSNIEVLSNDTKLFKSTLKSYLIDHMFYSLDESVRCLQEVYVPISVTIRTGEGSESY